jgi:GTP-binding protein
MSNFIDRVKIHVLAGHGGQGCVSFRREAYVPRAAERRQQGRRCDHPGDKQLGTLIDPSTSSSTVPGREQGRGKEQLARTPRCYCSRAVGTIVNDAETRSMIVDLDRDGMYYILAKGGRGGKGNAFFKTATNQAPRHAQPGEEGEEQWLYLELKLLADVGLVGFPNAGKSTLISRISAAKPKIADYPFTTLSPVLGVVKPEGRAGFVVADIPGLIENAHKGAGLGFEFLRHVEGRHPSAHSGHIACRRSGQNFQRLNRELEL